MMDVSAEYGLTDSVVIQVNSTAEYAELCTFKTGEDWETIVRSKIRKGNCVFRNLGASIVYLPVVVKRIRPKCWMLLSYYEKGEL